MKTSLLTVPLAQGLTFPLFGAADAAPAAPPVSGTVTWDPAKKNGAYALSNGNLTTTATGSGDHQQLATFGRTAGKMYWEMLVTTAQMSASAPSLGLAGTFNDYVGSAGGWYLRVSGYAYSGSGVGVNVGVTFADGDVLMFAADLDTHKLWYGKNGTWIGSPAAGTGATSTNLPSTPLFPAISSHNPSGPSVVTIKPSAASFTYTPPAGFTAWEIPIPSGVVTWNPLDKSSAIVLSGGDLTLEANTNQNGAVRASFFRSSGKFYFEGRINVKTDGLNSPQLGIGTAATSLVAGGSGFDQTTPVCAMVVGGGDDYAFYNPGNAYTGVGRFVAGDIIGFAVDITTGKAWLARNNTWLASGNPAAGTGSVMTFTPGSAVCPIAWTYRNPSNNPTLTARFANTALSYSPPAGFLPWEDLTLGADPFWPSVVLLLGFAGANGSTVITDSKLGTTVTAVGTAAITTADGRFGSSCLSVGAGGSLSLPNIAAFNFGTGPLCVEFHYKGGSGSNQGFIWNTAGWGGGSFVEKLNNGGSGMVGRDDNGGSGQMSYGTPNAPYDSTWRHVATQRRANNAIGAFVNGVYCSSPWTTGLNYANWNGGGICGITNALIANFRITRADRYTANFTPPAAAFPTY